MPKEIVLEITDLAYGGKGVGRIEGKVCFVPYVIVGERVIARIVRERRDFAEAELVKVLEPSMERTVPPCEYFGRCGGCSYQHLSYPAQLRIKQAQVISTLRKIGGFSEPEVRPVIPAPDPYHYRNRITVHTREGSTGFYDSTGRRVMDIRRCEIASEPVNQALKEYRERHPYDGVRILRAHSEHSGFCQTNDSAAVLLLEEVAQQVGTGELLVDAYCGSGFFAKRLRDQFRQVIGIEWNADSVVAAQANALPHETYWEGDVAEVLSSALASAPQHTWGNSVLLLDPPAQGLSLPAMQAILEYPFQQIIYVSCNAATLARDLKKFALTHRLAVVIPLDMFPQTAEIEIIAVLDRR